MKLYWRYKKDGKWTWKRADKKPDASHISSRLVRVYEEVEE